MRNHVVWLLCLGLFCAYPVEAKKKKGKKENKVEEPAKAPEKKPTVERDGLFRVIKVEDDWFFEIPDSLLGRQILVTSRFSATTSNCGKFAGELANERTVYWEEKDNKLMLRAALYVNVADTTQAIYRGVSLSNVNPILASFKIESHVDGRYKVKVTGFLNADSPAILMSNDVKRNMGLGGSIPGASYIEDIKSFPLNTEVHLLKTWGVNGNNMPAADVGCATFGMNLSFVLLPAEPMVRRYFDPRVGYFTDNFTEYTDDQQRVKSKRFITRWRLEPKPEDVARIQAGELVEPQKPIVYYIDPATPKQWRKYLIQGVNDWQKAFEKAGFKNAIVGKEWPENDSTMSMEDARYSVIRYLASPISNAYGPHVHDPRTGEILESHVCWYHNVMKLVHDWYMVQASTIDEAARKMHFDEELMGQIIRFVSSHEVGHTLGLRHNFGSSSTVPVDSLRDKAWVEAHGHTPSIMDYARFNYVAQPEDSISRAGIFPRVNDYDIWAIQWGYTYFPGATDEDVDRLLMEDMVKENLTGNPRLWYGDGESFYTRDPRCQTEDLGDDAVKASEYGIRNLKRELKQLPVWTYDTEDIYNSNLGSMYSEICGQFMRYNNHVLRNVGGIYRDFKTVNEDGPVYTPLSKTRQKAALDYLDRNVFTEPTWLVAEDYVKNLSTDPLEKIVAMGTSIIGRLTLLLDGGLNTEYTGSELLKDMTDMLFEEVEHRVKVTPYRAALQQSFVYRLVQKYNNGMQRSDSRAAVLITLRQLRDKTKRGASTAPDADTRAHYDSLNDVLVRALVVK